MSRIVIVSNRLPITIKFQENKLTYKQSVGGLATGLASLKNFDTLWIGWPGTTIADEGQEKLIKDELIKDRLVPVFLTDNELDKYYAGFCNKTVWPHFHYFTQYTHYNDEFWDYYVQINEKFAEIVCEHVDEERDLVWVHDYQLMLLPAMIRKRYPNLSIGFFLHIPFPSFEIFRTLPWRKNILEGILGADSIGFHTLGYFRHFMSAVYRICGYEHLFNKIPVGNRVVNVDVFPMSIDYNKYANAEVRDDVDLKWSLKTLKLPNVKIILSIDRLDYTKGIPSRIKAFEKFLIKYPEYREKVVLVMIVVPSRSDVEHYIDLKEEIETLTGKVNGEFTTFGWTPIVYISRSFSFEELTPIYQDADICLVTPLRDGMNLVAKEFVASKDKSELGVLILSEMAGAADELDSSLIVNPNDGNNIVQAIHTALNMSVEEQKRRMKSLQSRVKNYTVEIWAKLFITQLQNAVALNQNALMYQVSENVRSEIMNNYKKAKSRLFLIDYDGASVSLNNEYSKSTLLDSSMLEVLRKLCSSQINRIVIITGRDRSFLEAWLKDLPNVDIIAEHGVWTRVASKWTANFNENMSSWKECIRPLLNQIVAKTPGTFIEEKSNSIAWHYRGIDRYLGEARIREIRYELMYLTANLDLQVIEGNKVLEVKVAGINKGKAVLQWLNSQKWDFVLAIGGDNSDEEMFNVLKKSEISIYTVKIGFGPTAARYSLLGIDNVRELLKQLSDMTEV